jgi:parallel beta-helix repeat protein
VLVAAALLVSACSSGDDDSVAPSSTTSSTSTTTTTIPADECDDIADDAVVPLQGFIDEYGAMTPEEWNAIDPPPNADVEQEDMIAIAQAAVEQGCDPTAMEEMLAERIGELSGDGEVGRAIAAALRGEGPLLGPPAPIPQTTVPRDEIPTTVPFSPGDDLAAVLDQVAPGSTIRFAPGTYEFDEPVVVDMDLRFEGAGTDQTILSSSAEGVALTFVGPGGFVVEDMTIEHVGELEASVLLAVEGPLSLTNTVLRGGVSGAEDAGGGHGLVFAYDPLEGFPERTDEQRAGDITIAYSRISGNQAAGILMTGAAAPTILASTIEDNGGCGICYTSRSGGSVRTSTISGNQIGIQVSGTSNPVIDDVDITAGTAAGISLDENANVTITDSTITANAGIGVQAAGASLLRVEGSTVSQHQVGVLAAGTTSVTLTDNTIDTTDIGVQVGGEAVVETVGNQVRASISAAISYGDTSTGRIEDNDVTSAPEVGIQVIGQASSRVIANRVTDAGGVGISIVDDGAATVERNEVGNREIGIQIGGNATPIIRDNTVLDSAAVGILFGDAAAGTASGNSVTSPEAVGILSGGTSTPSITGNEVVGNGVGLVFREESAAEVRANTVREHTIGVQVVDGAAPFLFGNTVEASTEAGVAFAGTSRGRMEQNTLVRNGNISVQVAESAQPDIGGNEIRGEGIYAILFRDASAGRVRDNQIVNFVYGIQLDGTSAPAITGNAFDGVVLTNIIYDGSSAGSAAGNQCSATFTAGITVSAGANPTLSDNSCTVSR